MSYFALCLLFTFSMTCHSLCFERNVFLFHSLSNVRYTFFRAHGIAIRVI